tara:strand:+ start:69 stop:341 length:273 start_codon:yes stop_codon:yes gene_type:complete
MSYKTVGFQFKLDKAEKLEKMFYYIANKENEKLRKVEKEIGLKIEELGNIKGAEREKALVKANLRPFFKPNNQILYDIIEKEYERLGGKL